jgi:hypothetical protein
MKPAVLAIPDSQNKLIWLHASMSSLHERPPPINISV